MDDAQVNAVSSDDEAGTRSALKFLHHLGHRNIAFIRGPESVPSSRARWQPIQSFAQEARIELNQERIVDLEEILHPGSNFEAGAELTMELSRRGRPFTALLAFDDMTALGAVKALRRLGIQVPEGCSVMGFGDIPLAALSAPALSTGRQPRESMGAIAAGIVLDAIEGKNRQKKPAANRRRVSTELVIRETTRWVSSRDHRATYRESPARHSLCPRRRESRNDFVSSQEILCISAILVNSGRLCRTCPGALFVEGIMEDECVSFRMRSSRLPTRSTCP